MHDIALRNFKPRRDNSKTLVNQRGPLRVFGDSTARDMFEKYQSDKTMSILSDEMDKYVHEKMPLIRDRLNSSHNGHSNDATDNDRSPVPVGLNRTVPVLNHCKTELVYNIRQTHEVQVLQGLKYTDDDMQQMRRQMQADFDKRCEQLRQEHEARVEAQCEGLRREWEERSQQQAHALRKEYTDRLTAKEAQWSVETEELLAAAVSRDKEKDEEVERLQQQVTDMRTVVAEYEMTLLQIEERNAQQVFKGDPLHRSKTPADKSRLDQLEEERDQALADFANVETSFSHLYQRYEKMKTVMDNFRKNEDILKQRVTEMSAKMKKEEHRYAMLKKHAEERILSANEEIVRLQKQSEAEVLRLQTSVKRYELRIHNLEQVVEQKAKQNQELEAICDDLLSRVNKTDG